MTTLPEKAVVQFFLQKPKPNVKVIYSHIGVQLEVTGLVANGEVVPCHLGFGGVKAHLVTSEPPLVADDSSSVDGGASEVEVNIAAHVDELTFVGGLNLATLLAVDEKQSFR